MIQNSMVDESRYLKTNLVAIEGETTVQGLDHALDLVLVLVRALARELYQTLDHVLDLTLVLANEHYQTLVREKECHPMALDRGQDQNQSLDLDLDQFQVLATGAKGAPILKRKGSTMKMVDQMEDRTWDWMVEMWLIWTQAPVIS